MGYRYTTPAALRRDLEYRVRRAGFKDATATKTRYVTANDRECLEVGVFEYATVRMPLETLEGYERALQATPGVIATRIIHEDPRAARGNVNALRDQVIVTHLRMWDEPAEDTPESSLKDEGRAMTERIRWEPLDEDRGFIGYVDTLEPDIFMIWHANAGAGEWRLTSDLPGQDEYHLHRDGIGILKDRAERLLEEFVTSLGAVFGDAVADDLRSRAAELEMMVDPRPGQERDNLLFGAGLRRAADLVEHGDRPAEPVPPHPEETAP